MDDKDFAALQAASTLAKVDVPESDPVAKVSGEPAVAAPSAPCAPEGFYLNRDG